MSELRECPFCGSSASLLSSAVSVVQCGNNFCALESPHYANDDTEKLIRWWNTRPASRVEAAAIKFLHCVEQYHDAINLRDDLENSHMWSAELRRMYDAMGTLRAALAAEGEEG